MRAIPIDRIHSSPEPVQQFLASIESMQGDRWLIQCQHGEFLASCATSCLLQPAPGDQVLVAASPDRVWILSVLERNSSVRSILEVPGDLEIKAPLGRLELSGSKGLELTSAEGISLDAPRFRLITRLLEVVSAQTQWAGESLRARLDTVNFLGRVFDSVVERFSRKTVRSYRENEETDQVRSGQIDYRAAKNMTLRGRNILARSTELTKIDGEQIHMG